MTDQTRNESSAASRIDPAGSSAGNGPGTKKAVCRQPGRPSDSAATVFVVMQCDYEEQAPVAVYATRDAAEQEAKRLEALVPPRTTVYADDVVRYAYRVEGIEFHA